MSKTQSVILQTLVITLVLSVSGSVAPAAAENQAGLPAEARAHADLSPQIWLPIQPQRMGTTLSAPTSEVQLALSAAHRTTSYDSRVSERIKFDLPLLYLHREREARAKADRTLNIEITGLPAGREVQIKALSRHVDVSTGAPHGATIDYVSSDRPCTPDAPCQVEWSFDADELPSDFYYLLIEDAAGNLLWSNPHPERPDFVMLDTWDVQLEDYGVRVYYATLFPFARGPEDLEGRLSPSEVTDFVEREFLPMVLDTWDTQVHEWGFGEPLHPDWDTDDIVEIIITAYPFALLDGTGTYTVFVKEGHPYPERRIWWLSSNRSFQSYDSVENGCKVIFAHEFFHLMQWNVLLNTGRPTKHWLNTFIEAQGRLAQSVQYPELELRRDYLVKDHSNYVKRSANRFLTKRLNTSYREMEAESYERYDLALYWRYLYERYNGMDIVRVALEEMATHYDPDVVGAIGGVMNNAFTRVKGPFQSYKESLIEFARATYALRLANGRCADEQLSACEGLLYDPDDLYANPTLEAWIYHRSGTRTYDGAIPGSFGMDFVDVGLAPALQGHPLTVTVQSRNNIAELNVEIWRISTGGARLRAVTPQPEAVLKNLRGVHVYRISELDLKVNDRLALIITRLDADEALDPEGQYRVTLQSTAESADASEDVKTLARNGSVAQ